MSKANLAHSDVLTDVLATLRPLGRVFCVSELSTPWSMAIPACGFAHFHVIERGGAWLRLEGSPSKSAVSLASGDFVLIPHGKGHTLADSPTTPPVPIGRLVKPQMGGCNVVQHGGGGAKTLVTCGAFEFGSTTSNPVLQLLPQLIHIAGAQVGGEWLEPTLKMLAHEARTPRPGSGVIVTRLIDVIVVQAIRAWLDGQPPGAGGWLGALRDRQIGAALGAIHREPGRPWRVSQLARQVGMSRSPFAGRFAALVGDPPLRYLTRWRLHMAMDLLLRTDQPIAEVAGLVGYESEAAFSRAFKRAHGLAPLVWRRRRLGG
jgi:AraC-like DNA-binding protein